MEVSVNAGELISESFKVRTGVKQGDITATTFFPVFFSVVFLHAFQDSPNSIYIRCRTTGGLFNIRRSHGAWSPLCWWLCFGSAIHWTINVEGKRLEVIDKFTYLGSTIIIAHLMTKYPIASTKQYNACLFDLFAVFVWNVGYLQKASKHSWKIPPTLSKIHSWYSLVLLHTWYSCSR